NAGTGSDTFTVTNTISNTTTTLNAGAGNDTVTVLAGAAGSTLNVNGQGGDNHFRVTPSANPNATFNFDTASQLLYTADGTLNPTGPNAGTITGTGVFPVTFTNVTNVFIGAGTLQFSAPTFAVVETGGTAVITVTRARGISGAVSVTFSTGGGTAVPGVDF